MRVIKPIKDFGIYHFGTFGKTEISSDVADYKNISMKPFGDCIVAAKFLEQFIENHSSWAHLDIAGLAFGMFLMPKKKLQLVTGRIINRIFGKL